MITAVPCPNGDRSDDFKPNFHALIVGAGLVGLAVAIFLRKAGYRVTILERDAELREIGAGIQLPVNSCRVLGELGLLDQVKAVAIEPASIVLRSYPTGDVLTDMPVNPELHRRYGFPYLLIHRADLRCVLYEEAVAQGAKVIFGAIIDPETTDFAKAIVRFSTGRQEDSAQIGYENEIQADLIIGADGAQSMCRAALVQRPNRPRSSGTIANRIVIDADVMVAHHQLKGLVSPPNVHIWLGPESLAVCYLVKGAFNIVLMRPAGDGEVFTGPRPVDVQELRTFFQDWDPAIRALLELAHESQKWMLLDVDEPPESWVGGDGRFVLAGDAAHACLPYLAQGTAMGFESASMLCNLLAKAEKATQIPDLLRLYDSARQPRTAQVINASRKTASLWQMPDGPLQVERDRQFREEVPPSAGYPNPAEDPFFQEWLFGFDARECADREWNIYRSRC